VPAPSQERRAAQDRQLDHAAQRDPAAAPGCLAPLYHGFHYIKRAAALTDGPVTAYRSPVFCAKDGYIRSRLVRTHINAACGKTDRPLESLEQVVLDFLSLVCDTKIHLDMDLEFGDMQLCNNLTILHSCAGFEDWPAPECRRPMIRLWLTFRERRPLTDDVPSQNGHGLNQIAEVAFQSTDVA
jgi:hypothetical protein